MKRRNSTTTPSTDAPEVEVPATSLPRIRASQPRPNGDLSKLGEHLVKSGLVKTEQLDAALAWQSSNGGLLGEILVSQRSISEQDLARSLSVFLGVELANLRTEEIEDAALQVLPDRYGIANAETELVSSTKATLNALNRFVSQSLRVASF